MVIEKMKYYSLHWHLLSAVILLGSKGALFEMFCKISEINDHTPLYKLYSFLFTAILFVGWLIVVVAMTITKAYRKRTNRSFFSDTLHYRLNYFELVNKLKDTDPLQLSTEELPAKEWQESQGLVFGKVNGKLIEYEPDGMGRNGVVATIWGAPGVGKTAACIIVNGKYFPAKNGN